MTVILDHFLGAANRQSESQAHIRGGFRLCVKPDGRDLAPRQRVARMDGPQGRAATPAQRHLLRAREARLVGPKSNVVRTATARYLEHVFAKSHWGLF